MQFTRNLAKAVPAMSDKGTDPLEIVMLGISWVQFTTASAAIDKADMRNLGAAWEQITSSPWMWRWDWTRFGGVAIALNVLAVCLLTIPALVRYTKADLFRDRPGASVAFCSVMWKSGFYAWMASFIVFIGYLNFMAVVCLYAAFAFALVLGSYCRYIGK